MRKMFLLERRPRTDLLLSGILGSLSLACLTLLFVEQATYVLWKLFSPSFKHSFKVKCTLSRENGLVREISCVFYSGEVAYSPLCSAKNSS